jgi:prepilin-type N-terminal cleavage/methylation domain-containing protein/prepilin-type processing-associated H-X9-DG protein
MCIHFFWLRSRNSFRVGRSGFTLIEILVCIGIIGLLIALLLPAIQSARESARRAQCVNNLKQLGLALHNYHDAHLAFPVGSLGAKPENSNWKIWKSANVAILPHIEQRQISDQYDDNLPAAKQSRSFGKDVIPIFLCPSAAHSNPLDTSVISSIYGSNVNMGEMLGATDYLYSKGPNDSWCLVTASVPIPQNELGMFDLFHLIRMADVTDGASNTIAMGEGTSGPRWKICAESAACSSALDDAALNYSASQAWSGAIFNTRWLQKHWNSSYHMTSIFGSTISPLNKSPVTETLYGDADSSQDHNCNPSTFGGPSLTSNFRSDHWGGGNFLMGDGSVKFISEQINPVVYEGASTIAGSEEIQLD